MRGIVAVVEDVTEEKRSERDLRQSEERFRRMVEIAAEGIWIVDGGGRTTFVNARMADLLGHAPEEMMGHTFLEYLEPEETDRARRGFEARKSGDRRPRDYRFRRRDGSMIWLDLTAAPIRDNEGNLTGILGMCTDVTERKQAERQLRQTQKLESLGILAGGIAHDFNNLLAGIMGNASLAADAMGPLAPSRPMLEDVVSASQRAAQLTRQLLAYAGKDHGASESVDLAVFVRELMPLLRSSIPKMVNLTLDLDTVPAVQGDPAQLQQVIMNLVINAAESIPRGQVGSVRIAVGCRRLAGDDRQSAVIPIEADGEEYVALTVTDTGSGMDAGTQARIFDPFFTTKFDGRGLGLSAVLGIVRGHRGTLTLRSETGAGTTIAVLLPVSKSAQPVESRGAVRPAVRTGAGTILVVDDEPAVRTLAQRVLERYGYSVLAAENGEKALEVVESHPEIRAVVLDLAMPVMSGDTAARMLHDRRPRLPLILSSGYSESEAADRFGVDTLAGFLQKPYTAQRLAEKIAEVL